MSLVIIIEKIFWKILNTRNARCLHLQRAQVGERLVQREKATSIVLQDTCSTERVERAKRANELKFTICIEEAVLSFPIEVSNQHECDFVNID